MDNAYNESTSELLTRSAGRKRKSSATYTVIAIVAVALLAGAAGFVLHGNSQYSQRVDLASKYFEEGNYEQAEIEFTAAAAMKPRRTEAREGLAYTKAVVGKYNEASELYQDLYDDTGDEKYREAAEETAREEVPENDELRPVRRKQFRSEDESDGPDEAAETGQSTSNISNGGRVAFGNGRVYYVISEEHIYYDEVMEDDSSYTDGAVYTADADGSNQRLLYAPDGIMDVISLYFDEGTLYALLEDSDPYLEEIDFYLVTIDPESGEELSNLRIGGELWGITNFFIMDHYLICGLDWDEYTYAYSVDLDTGEQINLTRNVWGETDEEVFLTEYTCMDGWVWLTEEVYCYEDHEEDDSLNRYWTEIDFVRVRPDGTGREVYDHIRSADNGHDHVTDISAIDGKIYITLASSGNADDDDGSLLMSGRVIDPETLETERVTDLGAIRYYIYRWNNVDGKTCYGAYLGAEDEPTGRIRRYDLDSGDAETLISLETSYPDGIYYHDGLLYIDVYDYEYDDDAEMGIDYDRILIYDQEGNRLGSLEAA